MNPTIVALGAGVIILLLLVIGLAAFIIMRRRRVNAEAEAVPDRSVSSPKSKSTLPDSSAQPKEASPVKDTLPSVSSPQSFDDLLDNEKVRILIVDDNPGTRENVSRLLYFEKDMDVIGQAVNGRQGVEMAIELKPHIVLMDINMPDMDGITATQKMVVDAPFSQVIIMSVQADQHYMKRAMAAGARDFQPKPFTSEELVNCIRRVFTIGLPTYQQFGAADKTDTNQPDASDRSKSTTVSSSGQPVIAVYSPKGGVGTSAIAANLAIALQQEHGDVALMDADLQFGDVSVHLNTRPVRTISDLIHDNAIETDLVPDILLAHDSGVKLLLSPPQPQLADIISGSMLKDVIETLRDGFQFVVVDVSKSLNDTALNVLEAADQILVITKPELPSVKSVKLFMEIADRLNLGQGKVTVVINQADMPGAIRQDKIKEVLKVEQTFSIPYDSKLHFALNNKGLSIYQQDPNAPSARAIVGLARQLISQLVATAEPETLA